MREIFGNPIFGTIFQYDPSSDSSALAVSIMEPFPLHLACRQRNYDQVKELLDDAIPTHVYATDENGMTPLQHLISSSLDLKSEEMDTTIKIMGLLRTIKRSKYEDINKGEPLAKAVAAKSYRIVEVLLKFDDLDVNAGDPLKIAVSNNSLRLAKLISAQPTVIVTSACMKQHYSNILSSDSVEFNEIFYYSESLLMLQSNFNMEKFVSISKEIVKKASEGNFPVESLVSFLSLFAKLEFQCLAILLCKYIKNIPDRILEHDYLKPVLAVKFPEQFKTNEDFMFIVKTLDLASDSLQFFESPKRFSLAFGDDFSLGQKFPITEGTVLKEEEVLSIENIDGIDWLNIEGSQTYLGARAFTEIFKLLLKYKDKFSGFVQTDSKLLEGLNDLTAELQWVAAVDYILSKQNLYHLVDMLLRVSIETLPLRNKVLLPYGFSNHDGIGHSMLCEFESLPDDKLRIYIFNTGDGISNHISAAIGGRIRYLPYQIFDKVPRNTVMESAFFSLFTLLSTPSKRESKYNIGGSFIYQDLLLPFERYLIKDLDTVRKTTGKTKLDFMTDQKSGTCSYMIFRMRARFQFGEDFRKTMTFINTFVQNLIIKYNLQHAKSSIFWKRALLARTESASRALYKWIRRGEERFTFNGNNMEEFRKFLSENMQSRPMNEFENEIYLSLRDMTY